MTERDEFAKAALIGFAGSLRTGNVYNLALVAKQAYELADAMLQARDVQHKTTKQIVDAVKMSQSEMKNATATTCTWRSAPAIVGQDADGVPVLQDSWEKPKLKVVVFTEEEREAIEKAAAYCAATAGGYVGVNVPHTLRSLLHRAGGTNG